MVVGVYAYRPFVFRTAEGTLDGLCVRVLNEIAREEGWTLEYREGSWTDCLRRLESGEIDLLPAIAWSPERAARFAFNEVPFLTNWGRLYTRPGVTVDAFTALEGLRVAVYQQGIFSQGLRRILTEIGVSPRFVEAPDYETIQRMLSAGQADAGVLSHIYSLSLPDNAPIRRSNLIFMPTELRFAAPANRSTPWLSTLDRHLLRLKADPQSVYHQALDEWSIGRLAAVARSRSMVRPLLFGLAAVAGAALVLFGLSLVLKRQVRRKTLALQENSRELADRNRRLETEMEERRQAQQALQENERRLSTLMGNLPGMVYRCRDDGRGTLLFVSPGSRKLLGRPPEDFGADGILALRELIHPEDAGALETVPPGGHYRRLYRVRKPDGGYQWVCDYGVRLEGPKGASPVLEGFITDITPQQEEELRLRDENRKLRSAVQDGFGFGNIVGRSPAMQPVYDRILKAASSDDPAVVYGESGTGKELVARAIHAMSGRNTGAFVPVNCGAIPENLLESEFFGHKKGAFTGADADRPGLMDRADGGTLFLDEIGDIPLSLQVKLLRALEGGGFTPVGGTEVRNPNVRIVAATNRNLKQMVASGKMRSDFYYRIHVVPIHLPPLRQRREDIPMLVEHFLQRHDPERRPAVSPNMMEALRGYHWPGNVRELKNVLNRFVALGRLDFSGAPASGE
ncbi:MAG: sigma 54-interacting transcriptional regulator, partial [Desulfococcaceae bacterium]